MNGSHLAEPIFLDRPPSENALFEPFESFFARWDDPHHEGNSVVPATAVSKFGNVNATGIAGNYVAPDISVHQRGFMAAIEPRVRALVQECVRREWVTYSSCQGHCYPGTAITPVERMVGIVPRADSQSRHIVDSLSSAILAQRSDHASESVRLALIRAPLADSLGMTIHAVDFVFVRRPEASWERYFASLEDCYERLVARLGRRDD